MFGLLENHLGQRALRFLPEAGAAWSGALPADREVRRAGFATGTQLATMTGWRPVETLAPGDLVMTFDHGPRAVTGVTRGPGRPEPELLPEQAGPVIVPAGALGNIGPMRLMPEQIVMIECNAAQAMTGDPFALVPATALAGLRGIHRERAADAPGAVEIVTLQFQDDELLYAEGGALVLAAAAMQGAGFVEAGHMPVPYTVFTGAEAQALLAALAEEDARVDANAAYAAAA